MVEKNGSDKLFPIYVAESTSDFAYQLTDELILQTADNRSYTLPAAEYITGTIEYFVGEESEEPPPTRYFSLLTKQRHQKKKISFTDLAENMLTYETGFTTCIFLARVIEVYNKHYLFYSKKITRDIQLYQTRSQIFARFIDELEELANMAFIPAVGSIIVPHKDSMLYQDGSLFNREESANVINATGNMLSKHVKHFRKNSAICRKGQQANEMYALLRGRIGVRIGDTYLAIIDESGQGFGELSFFLDGVRTATLVAEENTDLYIISRDNLEEFHSTHRDFFLNIARTMAKRISSIIAKITRLEAVKTKQNDQSKQEFLKLFTDIENLQSKIKDNYLDKVLERYQRSKKRHGGG